jgi:spore maturation protein CgeB
MRTLFVWPAAEFSIWDVGRGLRNALAARGDEIRDYWLNRQLVIAQNGVEDFLPQGINGEQRHQIVSEIGSQGAVAHALWHQADRVVIVSGLNLHPGVIWALDRIGIPTAVWLTESPYEDDAQAQWVSASPSVTVFTHERASAAKYGWHYLPHAFDPAVHHPVAAAAGPDVLFIGTGWANRQRFFEAVDWTGIRLELVGLWPEMTVDSPIARFLAEQSCVRNEFVKDAYCGAAINVNLHRDHPSAESLNPRAYELAACGAFQISDPRLELEHVFGDSVPVFTSPAHMEALIRHYLAHPEERAAKAAEAQRRVQAHTFAQRAATLDAVMDDERRRRAA